MSFAVRASSLPGVLIFEPLVCADERGYFLETWHGNRYAEHGVPDTFVQDNVSKSQRGTLRGLHLQQPHSQGKLVQVLDGEIFDVAVDVRVGSPTFGKWVAERLSAENHFQMYVPPGFAHGFCVLSPTALLTYKCTEVYRPDCEIGVAWNDSALAIDWPIQTPTLSTKDARAPRLSEIAADRLPRWES